MTLNELSEYIDIKLDSNNKPKDILFFTGAGISSSDPCGFPLGKELYYLILKYFTNFTKPERLLLLMFSKFFPLERILTIVADNYDDHTQTTHLPLIFDIFQNDDEEFNPPNSSYEFMNKNDYHNYFGSHITNNGKHFTVNIDQFIERNFKFEVLTQYELNNQIVANFTTIPHNGFLFKIHNDVNDTPDDEQGFFYDTIKNGLKIEAIELMDYYFSDVDFVIFVGYGGVDKYDITPYFKNKNDKSIDSKAIWINYSNNNNIRCVKSPNRTQKMILSKFKKGVAIECDPKVVLNKLFNLSIVPNIRQSGRDKESFNNSYENLLIRNTRKEFNKINRRDLLYHIIKNL